MIIKEKQPLSLNFACANRHDLKLGFAHILHHFRESLAFIESDSLNLVESAIMSSSQSELQSI